MVCNKLLIAAEDSFKKNATAEDLFSPQNTGEKLKCGRLAIEFRL